MSNHSKWFRFRFPRELAVCVGSSQLPAIKHAIAALVSDVLVVVFPLLLLLLLLPLTGCECDILRVSVSHCCWGRLETEGFQPGLHTMRHVKFFFALSAVAFPFFLFPLLLHYQQCVCVVVFFSFVTVVSLSAIFSMLPKCLLTASPALICLAIVWLCLKAALAFFAFPLCHLPSSHTFPYPTHCCVATMIVNPFVCLVYI